MARAASLPGGYPMKSRVAGPPVNGLVTIIETTVNLGNLAASGDIGLVAVSVDQTQVGDGIIIVPQTNPHAEVAVMLTGYVTQTGNIQVMGLVTGALDLSEFGIRIFVFR